MKQNTHGYSVLWVLGQSHLAELYRKRGDAPRAERIEDELRHLLKHADPDHPIKMNFDL